MDCIFCKIAAGEAPATVVYEDSEVMAFKDIAPVAPLHILVIPKRHIESLAAATPQDQALLGRLLLLAKQVAADGGAERGFRTVINTGRGSGQAVLHLHLHVIAGRRMGWPP